MKKGGNSSDCRRSHIFSAISGPTPAGSPMVRARGGSLAADVSMYQRCTVLFVDHAGLVAQFLEVFFAVFIRTVGIFCLLGAEDHLGGEII